jgi:phenylalanyl-tRNA synthetase alpha chain
MLEKILELEKEVAAFNSSKADEIEAFRIKFLGRKGILNDLFEDFKNLSGDLKRDIGKPLNQLKTLTTDKINHLKESASSSNTTVGDIPDTSLPPQGYSIGTRHPISLVRNQIIDIFKRIGFIVSEGPEIEDDWHNFTALNFPEEHPARDMQDTFFVAGLENIALRTHTSSVQVRVMENSQPPIRTISPGRVFRNEAISARAHCIFHQVEGLYIDKNVSFADLKQTLLFFAREMFGEDTQIRLRPSYFPFTEPSAEMDISCPFCKGKGCNICKGTGWVEILGCGMVDPEVLKNCNIDPEIYSGFAFGMGIERITMLKYMVNDLRHYFENDLRFLEQFKAAH